MESQPLSDKSHNPLRSHNRLNNSLQASILRTHAKLSGTFYCFDIISGVGKLGLQNFLRTEFNFILRWKTLICVALINMFSFIGRTLFSGRLLLNRNLSTHYQFWWRGKWMRVAWEMSSHSNYTHCTIGNHFLGGNTTTITMYCPISKQKSSFKYLCSYVSYEMILVWRAKWMYLWRKKC